MTKLFFIPESRMNAAIAETILPGQHIRIDDYMYLQLSRAPRGKRIDRKLQREDERILIYF